jgi:hypothetical protein
MYLDDELKIPFVSQGLLEYLEVSFGIDTLLTQKTKNNDEHLGYIKGVREVLGRLRAIHESQDEQGD